MCCGSIAVRCLIALANEWMLTVVILIGTDCPISQHRYVISAHVRGYDWVTRVKAESAMARTEIGTVAVGASTTT